MDIRGWVQTCLYELKSLKILLGSVSEPEPGAATFLVEPEPEPYFSLKTAPAPD